MDTSCQSQSCWVLARIVKSSHNTQLLPLIYNSQVKTQNNQIEQVISENNSMPVLQDRYFTYKNVSFHFHSNPVDVLPCDKNISGAFFVPELLNLIGFHRWARGCRHKDFLVYISSGLAELLLQLIDGCRLSFSQKLEGISQAESSKLQCGHRHCG